MGLKVGEKMEKKKLTSADYDEALKRLDRIKNKIDMILKILQEEPEERENPTEVPENQREKINSAIDTLTVMVNKFRTNKGE